MEILLDIIYVLASIFYLPAILLKRKWHKDFSSRFGIFSPQLQSALAEKNHIWLHAVSVGEVLAVTRLVANIKKVFPILKFVISTVTQTGYTIAKSTFPNDIVLYAPLDFSFAVRRYLRVIKPKIYIAAETEIWPNLFFQLAKKHIPIVLINGRISDKAYERYKLVRPFLGRVLKCVSAFCMQNETYAKRIKTLGADEKKVFVVGNMKFDELPFSQDIKRKDIGLKDDEIVFVAGSTHPGEEEILLDVYNGLLKDYPTLRLVMAPRHIERTDEILKLIEKRNFVSLKFSLMNSGIKNGKAIIVIDTIGKLKLLYGLADFVFVGKSLTVGGGHNIIEPAFFAKPIFIGPHMANFQEIVELFLGEKAVVQVKDSNDLQQKITWFLKNPQEMKQTGLLAKSVVEKYTGATLKTVNMITALMADAS